MDKPAHIITLEGLPEGMAPTITCLPGDTLLGAAMRAGLGLAHECASGGCGSCKVDLRAGELELAYPSSPGLKPRDFDKGKRLACMCRPVGDVTIRFRESEAARPPLRPRRHASVLAARFAVTRDIFELRFALEEEAPFLPGQFALLEVPGLPVGRAYSLANLPGTNQWHVQIRRVGQASTWLLDELAVGESLTLDGPYGHAYYRPGQARDVVCVAGGSGLAPMLSVARAALADATWQGRHVHFYYGARRMPDMISPAALGLDDPRVRFHPVLSEGEAEWSGPRGHIHETLQDHLRACAGEEARTRDYYLAGPPPMVEAVRRLLLLEQSIPVDQVHYDRFF